MAYSKILLAASAIVIILMPLFLAFPTTVHASNITIEPSSGTVSTSVHINGDGFAGQLATVYWDKQILLTRVPISTDGELAFDLKVPTVCRGSHTITIIDDSNWTDSTASATFTVLPGIEVFPRIGQSHTQITVTGQGFTCFERDIKVTWDKTALPISAAANHLGVWTLSFDVPEPAKGEYYISSFSSSTDATEIGEHKFIVAPFAKMQPSTGPVGTEIEIEGFGFRTSEDGITITLDDEIILCNLIAGFDGVFDTRLKIPPAIKGHHLVGVFGSDFTPRGLIPDMDFNVVPNIQLRPASGNKGTKVTVDGTGFAKGETITLSYEGISLNTDVVVNDKGSFTTSFMAPQSAVKENKVKAAGMTGNSAETIFNMDRVTPPAPLLVSPMPGAKLADFDSVGDIFLGTARQLIGIFTFQNSGKRGTGPSGIEFDWSDINAQGKTTYTLEIANVNDLSSPSVLKKGLVDSQYILSRDDILTVGDYTWRVMAVDDIGNEGLWSEANEFEVIPMSNQVLIVSLVISLVFIGGIVGLAIIIWRRHIATR